MHQRKEQCGPLLGIKFQHYDGGKAKALESSLSRYQSSRLFEEHAFLSELTKCGLYESWIVVSHITNQVIALNAYLRSVLNHRYRIYAAGPK